MGKIVNDFNVDAFYHSNGWTVEVNGQIKDFDDEQIKYIHRLLLKNTVVVMRNQRLTPEDELRVVSVIGDPISTIKDKRVDDTTILPGIIRVTGKKIVMALWVYLGIKAHLIGMQIDVVHQSVNL